MILSLRHYAIIAVTPIDITPLYLLLRFFAIITPLYLFIFAIFICFSFYWYYFRWWCHLLILMLIAAIIIIAIFAIIADAPLSLFCCCWYCRWYCFIYWLLIIFEIWFSHSAAIADMIFAPPAAIAAFFTFDFLTLLTPPAAAMPLPSRFTLSSFRYDFLHLLLSSFLISFFAFLFLILFDFAFSLFAFISPFDTILILLRYFADTPLFAAMIAPRRFSLFHFLLSLSCWFSPCLIFCRRCYFLFRYFRCRCRFSAIFSATTTTYAWCWWCRYCFLWYAAPFWYARRLMLSLSPLIIFFLTFSIFAFAATAFLFVDVYFSLSPALFLRCRLCWLRYDDISCRRFSILRCRHGATPHTYATLSTPAEIDADWLTSNVAEMPLFADDCYMLHCCRCHTDCPPMAFSCLMPLMLLPLRWLIAFRFSPRWWCHAFFRRCYAATIAAIDVDFDRADDALMLSASLSLLMIFAAMLSLFSFLWFSSDATLQMPCAQTRAISPLFLSRLYYSILFWLPLFAMLSFLLFFRFSSDTSRAFRRYHSLQLPLPLITLPDITLMAITPRYIVYWSFFFADIDAAGTPGYYATGHYAKRRHATCYSDCRCRHDAAYMPDYAMTT